MTEQRASLRGKSEPRRFRLSWLTSRGYTVSVPNLLTDGEYIAVRDDQITDADVEAAALVIAHYDGYEGSDVVPHDAYRHRARKVLESVLGGDR